MTVKFTVAPHSGLDVAYSDGTHSFFFDPMSAKEVLTVAAYYGFQGVVIDDAVSMLTNLDLAASAAVLTSGMEIILTHWTGVMSPQVAAHQIAALDAKCGGRLALRMVVDESAKDQGLTMTSDGHVSAWQRTDEYLRLLMRLWSNGRPFDHEGPFYSVRNGFLANKGPRGFSIPIRISGCSGTAIHVAGLHADVFELPATSPDEVRMLVDRVTRAAGQRGRAKKVCFALPICISEENVGVLAGVDASAILGTSSSAETILKPYIEAGVSEFMLRGIGDADALVRFSKEAATLPQANSMLLEDKSHFKPEQIRPQHSRPILRVV